MGLIELMTKGNVRKDLMENVCGVPRIPKCVGLLVGCVEGVDRGTGPGKRERSLRRASMRVGSRLPFKPPPTEGSRGTHK